jgi:hypothetical protein
MISRLLLPSAVRLELRTPACEDPASYEPDKSCTAHCSGLPVATSVEAVAHYLSRGGFHRRHSAQTGEGAQTWLPPVRHEGHLRDGSVQPPRRVPLSRGCANGGAVPLVPSPPQALELVSGLRPRFHRGATSRSQGSDHLHTAVCALGLPGRLSGLFPVRAALSASRESDLLLRWRWRRFGRSTSVTGIAAVLR